LEPTSWLFEFAGWYNFADQASKTEMYCSTSESFSASDNDIWSRSEGLKESSGGS